METIWREFAILIGEAMARHWIAECDRRTQNKSLRTADNKKADRANRSRSVQTLSSDGKAFSPTHE
jgi:hypothetical protein